jgi:hypothetical protein
MNNYPIFNVSDYKFGKYLFNNPANLETYDYLNYYDYIILFNYSMII